ncbi:MAG: oligopeptide transporter, OPT family [Elusimicrobia bacterium GWA2_69_24]|nr:MAG: oligopeptide transporter, OPT family [Elusimicrobia bacterium GWA2_69_24]HBL18953.1 oligopeptide transporter, OPT family [Elusimicrobiota bacterium]
MAEFKPYIPAEQDIPEFTLKAVLLGSLFGILFGAVTVYLALRAGLTVSASIPIAVLSIAVFKRFGKSTILENNIVQTIGSAGESIAAGVVFTVPAFLFIASGGAKEYFNLLQIITLAAAGGIIGVLMMVPMRRALIVKEHGTLPYPEGTACAEVLIAGERGGEMAKTVFSGFWAAMLYTGLNKLLALWKETPTLLNTGPGAVYKNALLTTEITPEYLGVGYIIGPRLAGIMVSGSVLSWLALIPLLSMFVPDEQVQADLLKLSFTQGWIDSHSHAEWMYRAYIRYIGAGAVAMAGLMTLLRTLPTIFASIRDSIREMRGGAGAVQQLRTERDIPITWVAAGSLVMALLIPFLQKMPVGFPWFFLVSILVVVFGFFFVAVSSRIVGLIGSSSNPISGMTIATLLGTCLIFVLAGWANDPSQQAAAQAAALAVGAIVCIAAANAGATSQDLKTGYLVGATPFHQQIGLLIGVLVSVAVIGFTIIAMHNSPMGPIGSEKLPAPQGTLMATIIQGVLSRDLPWGYIFVGAALSLTVQLCGVNGLAWAVGAYLPISTTFPIFVGGAMRWLSDVIRGKADESELSSGMLYSTGLVAGGCIAGLLIVLAWKFAPGLTHFGESLQAKTGELTGTLIALGAFGLLCAVQVRKALQKLEL